MAPSNQRPSDIGEGNNLASVAPFGGDRVPHSNVVKYERDILDDFAEARQPKRYPQVEARRGLVVEDRSSGFTGDIVKWNAEAVTLRDRKQYQRHFSWKPGGFLIDGQPVTLVRPAQVPSATQRVTASGSVAADRSTRARVARASRIWVEGKHDAELVEQVWGDDLRELGIVVEPLHGADDLAAAVRSFAPGPTRRLGILLDHLVAGTKESRIAAEVDVDHVLITGHRYVDVWAAVRPKVIGIEHWPVVPKGEPWKQGVCDALGVNSERFWPHLRSQVRSYADLEPSLVGAVEQLIDFVADA